MTSELFISYQNDQLSHRCCWQWVTHLLLCKNQYATQVHCYWIPLSIIDTKLTAILAVYRAKTADNREWDWCLCTRKFWPAERFCNMTRPQQQLLEFLCSLLMFSKQFWWHNGLPLLLWLDSKLFHYMELNYYYCHCYLLFTKCQLHSVIFVSIKWRKRSYFGNIQRAMLVHAAITGTW